MMVAGIDYSTFCIDVVLVAANGSTNPPVSYRFPLSGQDAFERTRWVAKMMPGRSDSFWDEIVAVGIEQPAGHQIQYMARVQGAVLSMIPMRMLVQPWKPTEWRKRAGLSGRATKEEVAEHARTALAALGDGYDYWSQDSYDAFEIAMATRNAIAASA